MGASMSKARICDRCGKVCKNVSGMMKMNMSPYISTEAALETKSNSLDLCEQCFEEFGAWISEIFSREEGNT